MTDEELREKYPVIEWDEPIHITVGSGGTGKKVKSAETYACRYCLAHNGVSAWQVAHSEPLSREAVEEHIAAEHKSSPAQ